jgi:sec-independent protein translocase protein TatC
MSGAEEDKKMPLLEHLVELRTRLLYAAVGFFIAFFACFFVAQDILDFLQRPLAELLPEGRRMIFTDLTEPFFTQLKVAAFGALCLSFPIIAAQLWAFIAPGLYKHEKRAFLPFLVATPVMFAIGMAFVYYVLMPMAWDFFLGFETGGSESTLPIQLEAKIGEYVSLVMKLVFAFGFCFELPVLLTLLAKVGIVGSQGLRDKRRYAIVGIVVVAAIVTPPDAISMLSLAVPMVALYEISILMARLVEKKRAEEEAEPDESEPGTDVKPA